MIAESGNDVASSDGRGEQLTRTEPSDRYAITVTAALTPSGVVETRGWLRALGAAASALFSLLIFAIASIALGAFGHACASNTQGDVFCWGSNSSGQTT